MRKLWIGLGSVAALILITLLVLPMFFNADAQRGLLASRLEAALGRKVKLGSVRLGLLPPALQIYDTEIAESLGFTGPAFSTAKTLRARVRLIPLLRGRLEVPYIELVEPVVRLVKNVKGEWNFASLGRPAGGPPAQAAPSAASQTSPLEIGELRIRNGRLTVTDLEKRRPTVSFEAINLTVENFSRSKPFTFEVEATPPSSPAQGAGLTGQGNPGSGKFSAKGHGGPLDPENLAATPAEGEAKFEKVDLAMLQPFTEQPGLGGLFSGETKFKSSGAAATAEGTYSIERLKLSPRGGTAQAPVSGRYDVQYDAQADKGAGRLNVKQFQFGTSGAVSNTTGHLVFGKTPAASLHTRVNNAPLMDVARVLPAFGARLPAGSSLSGGSLDAEMRAQGPLAAPRRQGFIQMRNARLANYNIAGQLGAVVRIAAGVDTGGKDTVIEHFRTSFVTQNAYTSLPDAVMTIPGLNINGSGGFADSGDLNFQGIATLTRAGGTVGSILQRVTGSGNTVPFRITGTLEKPSFQPDLGRMVSQQAAGQAGTQQQGGSRLLKGLGGLFGRR